MSTIRIGGRQHPDNQLVLYLRSMTLAESAPDNNALQLIHELVENHTDALIKYALHKTGNRDLSEDLVQETFLSAWTALSNFRRESSARTWLISILNHKIADYYRAESRKRANFQSLSDHHPFFEASGHWKREEMPQQWHSVTANLLDDPDFNTTLLKCIDDLPSKWGLVMRYKYIEEKKAEQLCKELDISTTNYWQIIHRAKLQLRKCLDVNWFSSIL